MNLPKPEPFPGLPAGAEGSPPEPPAVWLVVGKKAVQASYGGFCEELDMCAGTEAPKRMDDLATLKLPAKREALVVVVGRYSVGSFAAGVKGWEHETAGPPLGPAVSTEAGVPYDMRALEARRVPADEGPDVEAASGVATVFELPSTGNPGDRRLSVFLDAGDYTDAVYHWRLDSGRPGENPPPPRERFPGTIGEIRPGPGTTTSALEEATEEPSVEKFAEPPVGRSPTRVEVGEGRVWLLDGGRILGVSPETGETVSETDLPGAYVFDFSAGAGALWVVLDRPGRVLRIDPSSGEVAGEVPVRGSPTEVEATDHGVWVATARGTQSGSVIRIDPNTGEVAAQTETPGIAESVAVDAQTGDVWAVSLDQTKGYIDYEKNQLVRLDPATDEIAERFEVDGGVSGVVAGEGEVWVADTGSRLSGIDPRSREVRSVVSLPPSDPYRAEIGAGSLWAVGAGTVARVDLADGRAAGSLELGKYDTEDVAVGEGAVWVIGAGTGRGGTLTRVSP